jgi:hypothetical protein
MIILTMSFGNSWILKEQELNVAMLEIKFLTATSNLPSYRRNIGWCDTRGIQLDRLNLAHHAKQSTKTDHSRQLVVPNLSKIFIDLQWQWSTRQNTDIKSRHM